MHILDPRLEKIKGLIQAILSFIASSDSRGFLGPSSCVPVTAVQGWQYSHHRQDSLFVSHRCLSQNRSVQVGIHGSGRQTKRALGLCGLPSRKLLLLCVFVCVCGEWKS